MYARLIESKTINYHLRSPDIGIVSLRIIPTSLKTKIINPVYFNNMSFKGAVQRSVISCIDVPVNCTTHEYTNTYLTWLVSGAVRG